ncbi:MAG: tetratricopeptide repeat protein [Candidatus Eisenbacteria bacterium]|nr:tetratricopeptide repeat protein [Candidatus Eisenbacteria bacterium]
MSPGRLGTVFLLLILLGAPTAEAEPTYPMDTDPIKLGTKALEEGQMDEARTRFDEARAAGYQLDRAADGLGRVAAREGRYGEAEAFFREAIELRKSRTEEFPGARAELGRLLLRTGRWAEAGMEFDLALAADDDLWPANYGRGRMLLEAGHLESARAHFEKGASRNGVKQGEDLYHHGMALYYLQQKDLTGAESEALVASGLVPLDPDYAILVATIYEQKNIPALALGALEKALAAPGQTPTAPLLHSMGGLYQRLKRYNEARDSYLKAVQIDSTYAPAFLDLGNLFGRARQYDRAQRAYRRYLDIVPNDVAALISLAETELDLGQPTGALEAVERALAADSSSARARSVRVRAGLRSPDKAVRIEAVRQFAALPDTVGWTATDWTALATGQTDAGNDAAAETSLRQLLALEPESAESWFQYGLLDMNAGRPDSARVRFEKSLSIKPEAPLTWLNLGIAFFQAKRTRDSIPAFRRAVALDSTVPMGRLLLAQALAVSDSLPAAEAEYRRVLTTEPGNPRALRGVAYCQIRGGRYAEAAKSYEAATRAEPGNADGWAGLGNAYLGLSRLDASEEAFRKAMVIDPRNVTMKKGMELLEKARASQSGGG